MLHSLPSRQTAPLLEQLADVPLMMVIDRQQWMTYWLTAYAICHSISELGGIL